MIQTRIIKKMKMIAAAGTLAVSSFALTLAGVN